MAARFNHQPLYSSIVAGTQPTSRLALSGSHAVSASAANKRAARTRARFEIAAQRRAAARQAQIDGTLALVRAMNPGFQKGA